MIFNRYSVAEMDLLADRERQKAWARYKAQRARDRGEIRRPDVCEGCHRTTGTVMHHEDYGRPLDVTWLCGTCHVEADQRRREAEAETLFRVTLRGAAEQATIAIVRSVA